MSQEALALWFELLENKWMTTTGKWLVGLMLPMSFAFFYLACSVLEARRQWNDRLQGQLVQIKQTTDDIAELRAGTQQSREEFRRITEGFDEKIRGYAEHSIDEFHNAVRRLIELARAELIDEDQWKQAHEAFLAAAEEPAFTEEVLEEAEAGFLGVPPPPGRPIPPGTKNVRAIAGLGIEQLRTVIRKVRRTSGAQYTFYQARISELKKSVTEWDDLVGEINDEVTSLQKSVQLAQSQRDNWTQEANEFRADSPEDQLVEAAKQMDELYNAVRNRSYTLQTADRLAAEQKEFRSRQAKQPQGSLLDAWNEYRQRVEQLIRTEDEAARLADQFSETLASNRNLVSEIREAEVRFDAMRGVQTAVIGPNGEMPKGQIEAFDESDGTVRINIGRRAGLRSGAKLHVYRYGTDSKYLGMLQIVSIDSDRAIGRMLPAYRQLPVRRGDTVSSVISP